MGGFIIDYSDGKYLIIIPDCPHYIFTSLIICGQSYIIYYIILFIDGVPIYKSSITLKERHILIYILLLSTSH